MAERPLQEIAVDPPSSRMLPAWVWGCSAGCLLLLLIVIGGTCFAAWRLSQEMGPEKAWPALAEVFPFEERPEGYTAVIPPIGGMIGFLGRFIGTDADPELQELMELDMLTIMRPGDNTVASVLIGSVPQEFLPEERSGAERVEFELQGRRVEARRYRTGKQRSGAAQIGAMFDSLTFDLELPPLGHRKVLLLVQRPQPELTPEDVADFLAPFDLWRNLGPVDGPDSRSDTSAEQPQGDSEVPRQNGR